MKKTWQFCVTSVKRSIVGKIVSDAHAHWICSNAPTHTSLQCCCTWKLRYTLPKGTKVQNVPKHPGYHILPKNKWHWLYLFPFWSSFSSPIFSFFLVFILVMSLVHRGSTVIGNNGAAGVPPVAQVVVPPFSSPHLPLPPLPLPFPPTSGMSAILLSFWSLHVQSIMTNFNFVVSSDSVIRSKETYEAINNESRSVTVKSTSKVASQAGVLLGLKICLLGSNFRAPVIFPQESQISNPPKRIHAFEKHRGKMNNACAIYGMIPMKTFGGLLVSHRTQSLSPKNRFEAQCSIFCRLLRAPSTFLFSLMLKIYW